MQDLDIKFYWNIKYYHNKLVTIEAISLRKEIYMVKNVVMPKLGAEMTAGRIVEWKKRQGEWVAKGEILVVIETDKLTVEVESAASGYLLIGKNVGEEVPVSVAIGIMCDSKEEFDSLAKKPMKDQAVAQTVELKTTTAASESQLILPNGPSPPAPETGQELRITPLARKLANEYGLDIRTIAGTGPEGRIKQEDILQAIERRQGDAAGPTPQGQVEEPVSKFPKAKTIKEVIPIRGMRKVIADRLYQSLQQMAQFTEMGEIDVTETVKFRQKVIDAEALAGSQISYNAILVKVAALILKEIPILNSSVIGEEIHLWNEINIGLAVSLEEGLIVPVIRNAIEKSIVAIHHELTELIQKTRNHKLTLEEISGSTFTISNIGSYGASWGTPIINPPEAALLAVGVIHQVPAVINNEIVVRWSMGYALTMDHRIIDGATGGRFTGRMRQILGNPNLLAVMW